MLRAAAIWPVKSETGLTKSGKLGNYRDHVCPFCNSTIVMTNLPVTPQVYCNFCDTLFSVEQQPGGRDRARFSEFVKIAACIPDHENLPCFTSIFW